MSNSQARADNFTESFIASVLATHPSILSADAERQAAKEEVTGSWRQILPELQVTTAKATDSASNAPVTQPKNTIVLEQKLWAGGKLMASIDAAKATNDVAAYKYEETRISLALNAIEALQAFRASTDRIQVIDETLRRLNRFVQLMDRRVAAEVSPPIDAVLVRSRLVQAQVDKSNAVAARNLSISRLQQLNLGGTPIAWEGFSVDALGKPPSTNLAPGLGGAFQDLEQIVNSYPSVRRYESEAEVARHRHSVLSADQYPTVYARIERNRYDTRSSFAHPPSDGVNIGFVGVRFTPGAGLASMSYASAAAQRAQAAKQQADAARRELVSQLRQDWEEWQSANSRVADYRMAVKNAEAVSDSYERQFIVGRLTWQQTLDAVRELGQVGSALADTEASLWAVSYKLRIRQGLFNAQEEAKL